MMLHALVRRYDEVPWIHRLRDFVRRWMGVEALYVDRENNPIFMAGQPDRMHNRVCATCLSSDRGRGLCSRSMALAQAQLCERNAQSALLSYSCHLGMTVMVFPVLIEATYRGMLYTTGFFDEPADATRLRKLGEQAAGINPSLANVEVLKSVPALSGEDLSRLEECLELGVGAIVTLYSQLRSKEEEIEQLRKQLNERAGYAGIVGSGEPMQEVYRLIERVAANDCTVLVRGDSGTGKELVARAIHTESHRNAGPFVVQNCSAFNDNLLESELFGHVRGAFTGAISDKKGLFEVADKGVLFLDEVAEMSPALQAKLLRVLQDHTFLPVGATAPRRSDVRIVAATHRDLEEMVKREQFREDLYYRLNVVTIKLPPLRERRGDIPSLIQHFLKRHNGQVTLTHDAVRVLSNYDWPGNVRELGNEIERMTVLAGPEQQLGVDALSERIVAVSKPQRGALPRGSLREALVELESQMIRQALRECDGNRSHAAKRLGIARSNLIVKLKAYGLD